MELAKANDKDKATKGKKKATELTKSFERVAKKKVDGSVPRKAMVKKGSTTKGIVRKSKSIGSKQGQFLAYTRSPKSTQLGDVSGSGGGIWSFLISPKKTGLEEAARDVWEASPIRRVELERQGMPASFVKRMAKGMDIPANRLYTILGVSRATANRQVEAEGMISGAGGYAAVAMLQLIGEVEAMLADSTSDQIENFDSAKWLGQWIERSQPALGGKSPAELLDTPTGVDIVSRTLGSISSGAYQ